MKRSISFLLNERSEFEGNYLEIEEKSVNQSINKINIQGYIDLFLMYKKITNRNDINILGKNIFLNNDIKELIMSLYQNEAEISITTNGKYIEDHLGVFKCIKKVYFNVFTLNESSYEKIVGLNSMFRQIKRNIENIRSLYYDLDIVLNIMNCQENDLNILELREVIEFANKVRADIQITGIDSIDSWRCITYDELAFNLLELGYSPKISSGRVKEFSNGRNKIFIEQCIFPISNINSLSIKYCLKNDNVVIYDDGKISIGDFYEKAEDIYKFINKKDNDKIFATLKDYLENYRKNSCINCLK